MAVKKREFTCTSCGTGFPKWLGRCPVCNEWNTIEEPAPAAAPGKREGSVLPLASLNSEELKRIATGINEFNLVCGGGIVPGSVILIGGEPGIGKSTLAIQIGHFFDTLYVSGEESPMQLRQRAERLSADPSRISICTSTEVEEIIELATSHKPQCLIIDSIQTVYSSQTPGIAGSVSQIREVTVKLVELAKRTGIPVILVGHITKEGSIAGPKLLEHLVDTVLYFEGNFNRDYRLLRAIKNRFGSVNEIGLFMMTERGLAEVTDRNRVFLSPSISSAPGNAVSAALEGSRTILFEVQALVTYSGAPNPRRMADGFDVNRLILMTAVLEKHAGLKLGSFDVFVNVSGGFQINEPAADLAVAMAIASSLRDTPIPDGVGLIAEISLSGELRPVAQCARRLKEFLLAGFGTILLAAGDQKEAKDAGFGNGAIGTGTVLDAINFLL
ncbi:MAG: DNA repair protein RadA [Spirochaetes bacterium]|nr:DNA repair protein RadA [Spirochaetota bacterium]